MANSIGWGSIYSVTNWGKGVINNISWGKVYANLAGAIPSFALDFTKIATDFTFTRNSFATRVNENGLIETVTDLGAEEVANGTFDLGSQLIVNGSFDTDTDWTKVNSTISGGMGNLDGTGVTSLLYQSILTDTKTYTATFTVSNYNGLGESRVIDSSGRALYTITSNGTFTFTFTHVDVSSSFLFRARTNAIYSIDNVSVKEVDPNDYWNITNVGGLNGWRILDGRAICDTVNPLSGRNLNSTSSLTSGKTYKLTLDILQSVDGMTVLVGATSLAAKLPTGTNLGYEYIIDGSLHTGGAFVLYAGSSDLQEVDNVSVKEVLEDDVPRIDYSSGEGAFLLEPASTNLYLNSETLSTQDVTTSASTYTVSFRGTGSVSLSGSGSGTLVGTGAMDLVSLTFTATAGTLTSTVSGSVKYSNLENLGYSTSWIPTDGTIATRAQETCVGATPTINSEEGVLYAEIAALADDSIDKAFSINNGGQTDRIWLGYSTAESRIYALGYTNNVLQFVMFKNLPTDTDMIKVAVKYKENDFALWVNGIEEATDTSGLTPIGLSELSFNLGGSSSPFYGNTKDLKIYDKALTDDELVTLTTI